MRAGQAQRHAPFQALRHALYLKPGLVQAIQHGADVGQQHAARFTELDASAGAYEKTDAEVGLQIAQLLAERRLRNVQLPGRFRKALFFRNRREVPKLPQVHGWAFRPIYLETL
ncbi:hypothetical protein D3C78_1660720 [compost metagenome]